MARNAAELLLVGCGKMGGALLERAGASGFAAIRVIDPAPQPQHLKHINNLTWLQGPGALDDAFSPHLIVIAIKPQHMASVLPAYGRFKDAVFLSIAAGTTLARLTELLGGAEHAIVRAMPNLPASIGAGITAASANGHVTPDQHDLCDTFLKTVGDLIWFDDEQLINVVTAYAGVPAYTFALVESLAKAGEALGLSPALAMQFARKNVAGSGKLLDASEESAEALRRAVTSPGGTTEPALKHIIKEHGLDEMMLNAMTAGTNRARELAK